MAASDATTCMTASVSLAFLCAADRRARGEPERNHLSRGPEAQLARVDGRGGRRRRYRRRRRRRIGDGAVEPAVAVRVELVVLEDAVVVLVVVGGVDPTVGVVVVADEVDAAVVV